MADEQLLAIVTTERRAYRQIAFDLAAEELRRRGLSLEAAAMYQRSAQNRRRVATTPSVAQTQTQPPPSDYGFVWFCEIMCAAVGSIILAVIFVSGRETQKAVLRWAATGLVLPYTVWRGAKMLDSRCP
jgi:hypothetical protein